MWIRLRYSRLLMSEAGPKAIIPLTRWRDGALGVRAVGGESEKQGVNDIHIHQVINVTGNGDKALTEAMKQATCAGVHKKVQMMPLHAFSGISPLMVEHEDYWEVDDGSH
ncbi:phage tail tape measure protein [Arsenophonus endosymbiont of Aleurodicus floccissimus]|uniref:phage tail tape measure protein n=1 Tax=Arsenophonus endosymbiont of Aleurodicus floccissimus TaxID=2152761 RepID=UPI001EE06CE5|nr:hypothetical protein [Arsenophonus endosymbiont of Aleurodicus floccissimus]